jgi:hypothetical protein
VSSDSQARAKIDTLRSPVSPLGSGSAQQHLFTTQLSQTGSMGASERHARFTMSTELTDILALIERAAHAVNSVCSAWTEGLVAVQQQHQVMQTRLRVESDRRRRLEDFLKVLSREHQGTLHRQMVTATSSGATLFEDAVSHPDEDALLVQDAERSVYFPAVSVDGDSVNEANPVARAHNGTV